MENGFQGKEGQKVPEVAVNLDKELNKFFPGAEMEYASDRNLALAPAYSYKQTNDRKERADLKVVSHPNYKGYEVMVVEPRSFGEAGQIVQNLKDRKTIILNLHLLDKEQALRTIDFVCGAAHALCGKPQKVGDTVYLCSPKNLQVGGNIDTSSSTVDDSSNY